MLSSLLKLLRSEPALIWQGVLTTAVALVVAYGHLSTTQNGYLTAIALSIGTVLTAVLARKVTVALVTGALNTVLSSLVVFSVHLDKQEIAATVAAAGIVVALLLRSHLTPTANQD